MLLGCCHCDRAPEYPPPSIPPSESAPSSSIQSSSGPFFSTDDLICGICEVTPAKWKITLAGWDSIYANHQSCCQSLDGEYIMDVDPAPGYTINGVLPASYCRVWKSRAFTKNHGTAIGVAPSCAVQSTPLIVMGLFALNPGDPTSLAVEVRYGGSGFPAIMLQDYFSVTFADAGDCLYDGTVPYSSSSAGSRRCSYGTMYASPA